MPAAKSGAANASGHSIRAKWGVNSPRIEASRKITVGKAGVTIASQSRRGAAAIAHKTVLSAAIKVRLKPYSAVTSADAM